MKQCWSEEELTECWALLPEEATLLSGLMDIQRLGFSVLLKFFQIEGRFPREHKEIPAVAVEYVAKTLDVDASLFTGYALTARNSKFHRAKIRTFLGIRSSTNTDAKAARQWLEQQALQNQEAAYLLDQVEQWYRNQQVELPVASRLDYLVKMAIQSSDRILFKMIYAKLSVTSLSALDVLLKQPGEDSPENILLQIKSDAGQPSLGSVLRETDKLYAIEKLGLADDLTHGIADKLLHSLYLRARTETAWDLRRHPEHIRYSLLALYCHQRRAEIIDGLADLLIQLVHKINVNAEKNVLQEILGDIKEVHGKTRLLYKLARASLEKPDGVVHKVVFSAVDKKTLEAVVKEYQAKGPGYQRQIQTLARNSYRNHYRRMVPKILSVLKFRSNNQYHQPVITALEYLKGLQDSDSGQRYLTIGSVPLATIVPDELHSLVVEDGTRINRIHYEVCVLQALRERLRCKEIWIEGAKRYCNPDRDMPQDFEEKRPDYYKLLEQPMEADDFISPLQNVMREALANFNLALPRNDKVSLRKKGKNRIKLTPLIAQPEPTQLRFLKAEISKRWPMTSLLDVLKEAELCIGFTKHFKGLGNREILERSIIRKRLLLCLYGMGSNAGLKRILCKELGITYDELLYIKRKYIHPEALRAAIADVSNATFAIRQSHIWGEGTTA